MLLGGIGLSYIAYAAVAVFVVIVGRNGDFGASLQGWSNRVYPYPNTDDVRISHFASIPFRYYLAYCSRALCITLALLRSRIIGKT